MSLAIALNNSLSGLNINRQSLAILSQNIANANTQGYSRKVINQEALYLDGHGAGVSIADISRKVDDYLTRSIRTQNSNVGIGNVMSDYYDRIQIMIGKPGSNNSINSDISTFFNSLQALAQTPENSSLRVNAIQTASTLTANIRSLSNGLSDLRFQADQDLTTEIKQVNSMIVEVYKLNKTISADSALGKSVVELLDKRDKLISQMSEHIDVQTYTKSSGEMSLTTNSGVALLDENIYQLSYSAAGSVDSFANNGALSPVLVQRLDEAGNPAGAPKELVSSGVSSSIVSGISSGRMRGLIELRDKNIPDMVAQLDTLVAGMRDEVNRVHNSGTGFPGANSYTGTRPSNAQDYSAWSGSVRIAVLGSDGLPVASSYSDEPAAQPLTLDLSALDTGTGRGQPTLQGLIDAINYHYGTPQNKLELGNLNNIRLVSNSVGTPGSTSQFNFDFDLQNISGSGAKFFVTGMSVKDNTGTTMTGSSNTLPTVGIADTFNTTLGSNTITINTSGTNTLANGDRVYISPPAGAIDGIQTSEFGRFFTVSNVTSTGFDIQVNGTATTGAGPFTVSGMTVSPAYTEVPAGEAVRTNTNGTFTADLSDNSAADYYTITLDVAVEDEAGNLSTSTVTYRINNNQNNLLNDRYVASSATSPAALVSPASSTALVQALLVDENGVELPKINGEYTTNQVGYLKLQAADGSYIAIDSLNSAENGHPRDVPPTEGTGRSFSHYFELNNFFVRNQGADSGSVNGSARDLAVESRFFSNPNLLSLGTITKSPTPSDPNAPAEHTYRRNVGDNSVIQALAALANQAMNFAEAGGLGQTRQTFDAYAGQIIGLAATTANAATTNQQNAQTLLDGYNQRSDSISGVNLDEELANTIIYQNAYSASARIITVVNQLFDTLIQTVGS